jgi:hypothetical protein
MDDHSSHPFPRAVPAVVDELVQRRSARRPLDVIEALLEDVVAKQATADAMLNRMMEEMPTKSELTFIREELRTLHTRVLHHFWEAAEAQQKRMLREEAIMQMLGDILARLPPLSLPITGG